MYGCQQELIKSPESIPFLEYLCTTVNRLINCGIYLARQWYFKLGYITGKHDLEKQLKSNNNYQFIHSQAAQQTLRGVISYPKQVLRLKGNQVRVPLGKKVKAAFKIDSFWLNFPSNLDFKKIREIRILPRNGCFYVEWVYQLDIEQPLLDKDKFLGVDDGVDNWLSCVSNVGTSLIVDGRHFKSVNQWYCKVVLIL